MKTCLIALSLVVGCASTGGDVKPEPKPAVGIDQIPVTDDDSTIVEFCDQILSAETTSLKCRDPSLVDLAPLAKLTNLKQLELRGKGMSDLRPLAKLVNLEQLLLGYTKATA